MNKKLLWVLLVVAAVVVIKMFFVTRYVSDLGFTTEADFQYFKRNQPTCYGVRFNPNLFKDMGVDSYSESVCVGYLYQPPIVK